MSFRLVSCAVFRVEPSTGIADSMAVLRSGDTLQLSAGLYSGSQNCDLQFSDFANISVIGAGRDSTIIDCEFSRCLTVRNCTDFVIDSLQFRNGRTPAFIASSSVPSEKRSITHSRRQLPAVRRFRRSPRRLVARVTVLLSVGADGDFFSSAAVDQPSRKSERRTRSTIKNSVLDNHALDRSTAAVLDRVGACVFVLDSQIRISSVIAMGCRGTRGGGIGALRSSLNISRCTFSGNGVNSPDSSRADETAWGAGAYFFRSEVSVLDTRFDRNFFVFKSILETRGCGAYFDGFSVLTIGGESSFSGNRCMNEESGDVRGCGMHAIDGGRVTVGGLSSFAANVAFAGPSAPNFVIGGGVLFRAVNRIYFEGRASFDGNVLEGLGNVVGGGLAVELCGLLSINGSFSASTNRLDSLTSADPCAGGGLYCFYSQLFIGGTGSIASNTLIGSDNYLIAGGALHLSHFFSGNLTAVCTPTARRDAVVRLLCCYGGGDEHFTQLHCRAASSGLW